MTPSTAKILPLKVEVAHGELADEARKVYDLARDPDVPQEEKDAAQAELDRMIKKLEGRVETTRLERGAQKKK